MAKKVISSDYAIGMILTNTLTVIVLRTLVEKLNDLFITSFLTPYNPSYGPPHGKKISGCFSKVRFGHPVHSPVNSALVYAFRELRIDCKCLVNDSTHQDERKYQQDMI